MKKISNEVIMYIIMGIGTTIVSLVIHSLML